MRRESIAAIVVVLLLLALFIGLAVFSYRQESATVDEPMNLAGGYAALKLGDYRVTPQNEFLTRLWCALPLRWMKQVALDADNPYLADGRNWLFAHEFLYQQNDADLLLYRARFMTVLLGAALAIVLFCWAREWFGLWPAAVVLGLYCTEPNTLAHARVITSDMGFTCFSTATLYLLWRSLRTASLSNVLGMIACFTLALLSKFTGLLLGLIVAALLAVRIANQEPWLCAVGRLRELTSRRSKLLFAGAILLGMFAISVAAIWAMYGFRYAPCAAVDARLDYTQARFLRERAPDWIPVVHWIDRHHLLPNSYSQGFLLKMAEMQGQPAFLNGHYSETGWWYYFPAAFILKTPLPLLLLAATGTILCLVRRQPTARNPAFLLGPVAMYLAAAMTAKTDVGLRYMLPVFPLVMLLAGTAAARCLQSRRRVFPALLVVALLFEAVECARISPHYLAYFNQLAGRPGNEINRLVDSNLDWGQDLKGLKRWMIENKVDQINLGYFGTADPAYYGIDCTYLPGAPPFAQTLVREPRLPGYVAVSATHLQGVYLGPIMRSFYKPLLPRKPIAVIGDSIYIYRVESRWW